LIDRVAVPAPIAAGVAGVLATGVDVDVAGSRLGAAEVDVVVETGATRLSEAGCAARVGINGVVSFEGVDGTETRGG
jgi:hypothetical protein